MKNQKLKNLITARANLLKSPSEVTILNNEELMKTLGGFTSPCTVDGCGSDACATKSCTGNVCGSNVCTAQTCGTKYCQSNT